MTKRRATTAGTPRTPRSADRETRVERTGSRGNRRATGRDQRLRRLALPALFVSAGLAILAIVATTVSSSPKISRSTPHPALGPATASLVVREYGDFQCPSCGAFARSIEAQLRAAYIDTGRIRFEWHDFPWIGQESLDAANAARCANDQGKFWQYHDLLYANQGGENSGAFSTDRLKAFGHSLGLDAASFDRCVDGSTHAGEVAADFADVRDQGFTGTPTFLVGDRRIVGAQPFPVFQAAIDAALAGG